MINIISGRGFIIDIYKMYTIDMYKDKEVKKFLSMCDVKIFLTFTSPNMVLL
jgi:hypothetical protein